jgi:hypothetical protein
MQTGHGKANVKRAIKLGAPPLVVLLVVASLLVVFLSGHKASVGRHGPLPFAEGLGAIPRTTGASTTPQTAQGTRDHRDTAGLTGASTGEGAQSSNGGTPAGHSGAGNQQRTPGTSTGIGAAPSSTASVGATSTGSGSTASVGATSAGSTANGTLESGRSETGSWSATSSLGPELEPTVTEGIISFPTPLAHQLGEEEVIYISEAETAKAGPRRSASIRAACGDSGTLQAPTANPGYLCVYVALEDFRDRNPSGGVPTHDVHGVQRPFIDAELVAIAKPNKRYTTPGASRTGAAVAFGVPDIRTEEEESANAYAHITAHGTWAVTAP